MPWESGSGAGKYQYYPGGDPSAAPKDAPSAVNVVVVPNVNLPKVRSTTTIPSSSPYSRYLLLRIPRDGPYDNGAERKEREDQSD